MSCIHIIISGDVHGHGLRSSAMYFANQHNIKGYVQYENPDTLGIVAQGDEQNIMKFTEFCMGLSQTHGELEITIHEERPDDYHAFAIRNSKAIYQPGQKKQFRFNNVNFLYNAITLFFHKFSNATDKIKSTITKGQTT